MSGSVTFARLSGQLLEAGSLPIVVSIGRSLNQGPYLSGKSPRPYGKSSASRACSSRLGTLQPGSKEAPLARLLAPTQIRLTCRIRKMTRIRKTESRPDLPDPPGPPGRNGTLGNAGQNSRLSSQRKRPRNLGIKEIAVLAVTPAAAPTG